MIFRNNLSSLVFISGLSLTAAGSLLLDGIPTFTKATTFPASSNTLILQPARGLSAQNRDAARIAWSYFEANTRPETGLVDAVAGFPSGTLWDQGSYLLAVIAAERLGLVGQDAFHDRITAFLTSIENLPLYQGFLPNKVYDTRTLTMVDYSNAPTPDGVGWSALDVARLLSAFRILEHHHPTYATDLRRILRNWDLAIMTEQGRLVGASHDSGAMSLVQEGRIGYEQYGARAAALWGMDTLEAASAKPILSWHKVSDIDVPIDQRNAKTYDAVTPVLSEPFLLQALEMGLTDESRILAERVYQAQESRFNDTGIATMVSEGHIDQAPHFLYTSVYSNGRPWAVVAENGDHHPELRNISLKAVYGWNALYATEYTNSLLAELSDLGTETGWMSGRYESTGTTNQIQTANTNAVILEALHYIAYGPLLQTAQ